MTDSRRLRRVVPTPLRRDLEWSLLAAAGPAPGAALRSVRTAARSLRVNPATVAAVYRDLSRRGYLRVSQGRATIALLSRRGCQQRLLHEQLTDVVEAALAVGIDKNDLQDALQGLSSRERCVGPLTALRLKAAEFSGLRRPRPATRRR